MKNPFVGSPPFCTVGWASVADCTAKEAELKQVTPPVTLQETLFEFDVRFIIEGSKNWPTDDESSSR